MSTEIRVPRSAPVLLALAVLTAPLPLLADSPGGQTLFVEAHKCNLCHAVPAAGIEAKTSSASMRGSDLGGQSGLDVEAIAGFLRKETERDGRTHKKEFKGTDEELEAMLAWLGSLGSHRPPSVSSDASEDSAGAAEPEGTATSSTTAVIVVRHAEKQTESDDPELTMAGEERSHRLRDLAIDAGVTGIYASQFRRTQATVAPLAEALGLDVAVVDAHDTPALVDAILSDHAGGVVVVAGHSNTVPEIVAALGAPEPGEIPETDYGTLFVVVVTSPGEAAVLRLRF